MHNHRLLLSCFSQIHHADMHTHTHSTCTVNHVLAHTQAHIHAYAHTRFIPVPIQLFNGGESLCERVAWIITTFLTAVLQLCLGNLSFTHFHSTNYCPHPPPRAQRKGCQYQTQGRCYFWVSISGDKQISLTNNFPPLISEYTTDTAGYPFSLAFLCLILQELSSFLVVSHQLTLQQWRCYIN